jgi:eukaryotic-like serine/threonine-protein kinase
MQTIHQLSKPNAVCIYSHSDRVADYIRRHEIEDIEVVAELVREDMKQQASLGKPALVDDYLDAIPSLLNTPLELVALILDEHSFRIRAGHAVELDEYARRFPEHFETLRCELTGFDSLPMVSVVPESNKSEGEYHQPAIGERRTQTVVDIGDTVGDFRIDELLGTGGVSKVYRARQLSLDRDVALKITFERVDELNDEGQMMASLLHDHIVPVHTQQSELYGAGGVHSDEITSVGDIEESPRPVNSLRILAMEYVAGPTLGEFLDTPNRDKFRKETECHNAIAALSRAKSAADTSKLNVPNAQEPQASQRQSSTAIHFACRTIRDLASALSHAHQRGVLHCDVKPANVLFAPNGRAMLTDFNVSLRNKDGDSNQRASLGGTLPYMAPEHLALLSGADPDSKIDARSDVYSLGIVFFELLTGRWPFCEANLSSDPLLAVAHLLAARIVPMPNRFTHFDKVSPGLRSIVNKCLESNSADRYQSADDLIDDLDRFLSNRPLRFANDPSQIERAVKCVRRHAKSIVSTVSAVGIFIAIATVCGRGNETLAKGSIGSIWNSALTKVQQASDLEAQGQGFFGTRKFGDAAFCFMQAVKLNPVSVTAQHNLAVVQFRLGRYSDAIESFNRVIDLGNRSALVYSRRAAARFGIGDLPGAAADFKLAESIALPQELDEVRANKQEFERRL